MTDTCLDRLAASAEWVSDPTRLLRGGVENVDITAARVLLAHIHKLTAERDAARAEVADMQRALTGRITLQNDAEVEAAFVAGQNDCGCNGLPTRTWAEHRSEHKP
jgi:hypothetical protein